MGTEENCTVNSEIFTVNGIKCTVNCTVNGKKFTVNHKVFTVNMPKRTKDVLWVVLEKPYISTTELTAEIGCALRTIKNHLASLKKLGVLKREGSDKNGSWVLAIDTMWSNEQ